jgi:hypothetical protein
MTENSEFGKNLWQKSISNHWIREKKEKWKLKQMEEVYTLFLTLF